MSLDVTVQPYADTAIGHHVLWNSSTAEPFVSVHVADRGSRVVLLVADPAVLSRLITTATAALADLNAATGPGADLDAAGDATGSDAAETDRGAPVA